MDGLAVGGAAARIGAGIPALSEEDRAYAASFDGFMRVGREEDVRKANAEGPRRMIQAAMSEGTGGSGGYTAPV